MLVTKVLLPQRRKDVLTRPRLLRRLYNLIDRKVILMSAPAGYGKSTLLVDFAHDLEHPVCWYSLDKSDRDPHVFLEHLILSLHHRFPDFGKASKQALKAHQDLSGGAPGVVSALVNEIVRVIPRWFVLVLDDYHELDGSQEIQSILAQLLAYQTDQFLVIIASRTVPEFPFTIRMAARGQIGGLGEADLRFQPEDIQRLMAQNYHLHISDQEAEELAAQSEGWITGLLLTVQTMWKGILASLTRAKSAEQPVYEYLAQEVFAQQPPAIQDFLIASSTLKTFKPKLCEEALGLHGVEHFLTEVEDRNLFIVRFEDGWYRYHHLFQTYLQTQSQKDDPSRWAAFHRRAAAWFSAQERFEKAVDHYMTIEAYENATEVMQNAAKKMYMEGRFETLMRWGEALPRSYFENAPRLALFQARAADMLGRWDQALDLAEHAAQSYQAVGDKKRFAYAQLHRCRIWQKQGKVQKALALAQDVLSMSEKHQVPVTYEAHRIIGLSFLELGALQRSEAHLQKALIAVQTEGAPYEQASVRSTLVDCLLRQGKLTEAIPIQQEVVEIRKGLHNPAMLAEALNDLGYALYVSGRYKRALHLYEEALTLARRCSYRRGEALTQLSLCELLQSVGAYPQALSACQEGLAVAEELEDRFLCAYGQETLGLVYQRLDQPVEAEAAIQRALAQIGEQSTTYHQGRFQASLGFVHVMGGAEETGLQELSDAVDHLRTLGAESEWARARLLRARALFATGEKAQALDLLRQLLETMDDVSERSLLATQGHLALPLLDDVCAQSDAGDRWTKLRRRLRRLQKDTGLSFVQATPPKKEKPPPIYIYGFGVGRVEIGGEPIPLSEWGAAATRMMLFHMLTHDYQTRDQIAAVLWPDLPADKVKATFHTTKFRLKRALGTEVLNYEGGYYELHPTFDYQFDVHTFEQLLEAPSSESRLEHLQAAIALYKDDFLTDCYDEWCDQRRQVLREQYFSALEELVDLLLTQRRYRRAIRVLYQGLERDHLRESFHRKLMRAYALTGERSRALNQYERWVEILRSEMDTLPSRRTTTLYERIRKGLPLD